MGRFAMAAGILWVSLGHAQAPDSLRLGAVYAALEAHPDLDAARARIRVSDARIGPAGSWPDPQIQFGLMGRQLPGLGLQNPLGMTTLQVVQMVPIGGQVGHAVREARARAAGSRDRLLEARWDLRVRAAMTFYDLYLAQATISLATESKQALEQVAATAQALYAAGQGRQADVLRAQVEAARMTEEVLRMQAMQEGAAARLNTLFRRPLDTPLGGVALPPLPGALPPLDSLERSSLSMRPALGVGRRALEASEAGVARARAEIWPDLELGLQYGQRPMDGGTDRMISLMLGASLPIHAGSRQKQMRLEALAMRDEASAELAGLESESRARLGELYAEFNRNRALITLYRHSVIPQAEAAAASALGAYQAGSGDLVELLDARMGVNRYRSSVAQWEAELGKALAELEMLSGAPLFDPDAPLSAAGRPR